MLQLLRKTKPTESVKLKLLEMVVKSPMATEGKVLASTAMKAISEEKACELIKDFYELLEHKDEIQEKLRQEFPSVFA